MNKKVISSVLAGAMAVSTLGVNAFAATKDKTISTTGSTTYKVATTVAAPTLDVTIPGTVAAVINPYGVSFKVKGKTAADDVIYGAEGVSSPLYTIKNNTEMVGLDVDVVATIAGVAATTKSDGIKVVADADTAKNADKKSIYAEIAAAPGADLVASNATPTDLVLFGDDAVADVTTVALEDATGKEKDTNFNPTVNDLMEIPAAEDGKFAYGQFQLGGAVSDIKVTPWDSKDKVTINLVLNIGITDGGSTSGGNVTAATALTAFTITDTNSSGATIPTFAVATNAYTITGVGSNSESYNASFTVASGYSVTTSVVSGNGTATVTGTAISFNLSQLNNGDNVIKVTVTNDNEPTDTTDYTFTFQK